MNSQSGLTELPSPYLAPFPLLQPVWIVSCPWNCLALAIIEDEVVVILHAQGEGPCPVRLALPHDPLPLLQLDIPALEKHHPELAIVAFECLPEFLRGVIGVRLQQLHPVGEPVQRVSTETGYLARAARRTQGVLGCNSIDS